MKQKNRREYSLFLALGSNLGDKENNIERAYNCIEKQIGRISSRSAFFYSSPVGFTSNNDFVNTVCEVVTDVDINKVFAITQSIEKQLGRSKKSDCGIYNDRVIDIDLILAGDTIINSEKLIIPHPRFQERNFVLIPLFEIAPDLTHPVLNKSIKELKFELDQRINSLNKFIETEGDNDNND